MAWEPAARLDEAYAAELAASETAAALADSECSAELAASETTTVIAEVWE